MKNFPEVNLVNLGSQTFVTPAPMDRESPRSPGHRMSPSHQMSVPETVSHTPRRFRPTPQPIFHVTMQTVMEHVSQLPDIRHVSTLANARHVSHSIPDNRHVSALPQMSHTTPKPFFGTLKPFVNLGSGPPGHHPGQHHPMAEAGHQLPPLRPEPGPVRALRPRRRQRNQVR